MAEQDRKFEDSTDATTAMAECFASHGDIKHIRQALAEFSGNPFDELELAVQTLIAIGEERGAELEKAFPQYAGANPANHDWPQS